MMKTYYEIKDDCIKNIIRRIFKQEQTVMYIYDNDTSYVDVTTLEENPSIITSLKEDYYGIINYNGYYVIYASDINNLKIVLRQFHMHSYWMQNATPKQIFAIFFNNLTNDEAMESFSHLKQYHIVNVLLIKSNVGKYNYAIYKLLNICNKIEMTMYETKCNDRHLISYDYYGKNFLRGCNFTGETTPRFLEENLISTDINNTGILIKPLEIITEYYGINFDYVICFDEKQELYVNVHVPIEKFFCGDFLIASMFRGAITFQSFDSSNIVLNDPYIWLLQKPKKLSNAKIILSIYTNETWLCILIILILSWFFLWLLAKTNRIVHLDLGTCMMCIIQLTFLSAIKYQSRCFVVRLFILVFLIYSYHVNYIFQGQLSSLLTKPLLEKSIRTTKELAESDIKPYMPTGAYNIMQSLNYRRANLLAIKSNHTINYSISSFDLIFSETNKIAVLTRILRQTGNKYNLVDKFEDDTMKKPEIRYTFANGSYLIPYVNNIIRVSTENGFMQKWRRDKLNYVKLRQRDELHVVLTFEHLELAFMCLCVGILLGSFVFFAEMLYNYLHLS